MAEQRGEAATVCYYFAAVGKGFCLILVWFYLFFFKVRQVQSQDLLPDVQVQWVGILSPFLFSITLNLISPDRSSALLPYIADHAALICSVFLTTPQFIALLLHPSCMAPGLPVAGSGCRLEGCGGQHSSSSNIPPGD